jgi:sulfur-carrier protein adenylyltransferase/sulfurtransferase
MFSTEELRRYNRQIILPQVGMQGQERLKLAKVLVVGAGGLGSPLLQYLTAAGVGTIGIIDADNVDVSNLQRQVIYRTTDAGKPKANTSAEILQQMNPHLSFQIYATILDSQNALQIIEKYDIVADCTDNFATRYLVNDACVLLKKPFVYAAIFRFEGQVSTFHLTPSSPTYRCLFPTPPAPEEVPNCAQAGVFGVLAGIIGLYQANEVLKIILGIGEVLDGKLLMVDMLTSASRTIKIKKRFDNTLITQLIDYEEFCGTKPKSVPLTASKNEMKVISVHELKQAIDNQEDIFIIDVREEYEYEICNIENAQLMPMSEIEDYLIHIPQEKKTVVYCHHGMRSANVIKYLERKIAHTQLYNLVGGIDRWAREIDDQMEVY